MRKLYRLSALAAIVLSIASCRKDFDIPAANGAGNEQTTRAGIATAVYIPDAGFRDYLANELGIIADSSGCIQSDEAETVTEMYIFGLSYPVESLEGIEYFTNLTSFACQDCDITSFDPSVFTNLQFLNLTGTLITSLDVSSNTMLRDLYCYYNQNIQTLNASYLPNLQILVCRETLLTSLEIFGCYNLWRLECCDNSALQSVHIIAHGLNSVNCSNNHNLNTLYLMETNVLQLYCMGNMPGINIRLPISAFPNFPPGAPLPPFFDPFIMAGMTPPFCGIPIPGSCIPTLSLSPDAIVFFGR
jgi:hypothetical protein